MKEPIICGLTSFLIGCSECTNSEQLYINECEPLLTTLPTFLSVTSNINITARQKEGIFRTCCLLSDQNQSEQTAIRIERQLRLFGKSLSILSKTMAKGVLLAVTLNQKNDVFEHYSHALSQVAACCRTLLLFTCQSCTSLLKLEQARQLTQAMNETLAAIFANAATVNEINQALSTMSLILEQINNVLKEGFYA